MDLGTLVLGLALKVDQFAAGIQDINSRMKMLESEIVGSTKRQASASKQAAGEMAKAHQHGAKDATAAWAKAAKDSISGENEMVKRLKKAQDEMARQAAAAAKEAQAAREAAAAAWVEAEEEAVRMVKAAQDRMAREVAEAAREAQRAREAAARQWQQAEAQAARAIKQVQDKMAADASAAAALRMRLEDELNRTLKSAHDYRVYQIHKEAEAQIQAVRRMMLSRQEQLKLERQITEVRDWKLRKAEGDEDLPDFRASVELRKRMEEELNQAIKSAHDYRIYQIHREADERLEAINRMKLAEAELNDMRRQVLQTRDWKLLKAEADEEERVLKQQEAAEKQAEAEKRAEALRTHNEKMKLVRQWAAEHNRRVREVANLQERMEEEMARATLSATDFRIWQVRRELAAREKAIAAMGLADAQANALRVRAAESANAQIRRIHEDAAANTGGIFTRMFQGMTEAAGKLIAVVRVIMAITLIVIALRQITDLMFTWNAQMEQATISMATIINKYAELEVNGQKMADGAEKFRAAMALSRSFVQQLAMDQLRTASTTEEMVAAAQKLAPMVFAAGGGMKELRQMTISATNAAKVLNIPIEQVAREMNEIVTKGHVDADNTFGRMLALSAKLKEEIAKGPVEALHVLIGATNQFNDAAEAYADSWPGLTSSINDLFRMFMGGVGEVSFELIKEQMRGIVGMFVEVEQTADGAIPRIRSSIRALANDIGTGLGQALKNWGEAFAALNTGGGLRDLMSWLGNALGQLATYVLPAVFQALAAGFGFILTVANKVITPVKWVIDKAIEGIKGIFLLVAGASIGLSNVVSKIMAIVNDPKMVFNKDRRNEIFGGIDEASTAQMTEAIKKYWDVNADGAKAAAQWGDEWQKVLGKGPEGLQDKQLKLKMSAMDDARNKDGNTTKAYQDEIAALEKLKTQYALTDHQVRMVDEKIASLTKRVKDNTEALELARAKHDRLVKAAEAKFPGQDNEVARIKALIEAHKNYAAEIKAAGGDAAEVYRAETEYKTALLRLTSAQAEAEQRRLEALQKSEQQAANQSIAAAKERAQATITASLEAMENVAIEQGKNTEAQIEDLEYLMEFHKGILDLYPDLYKKVYDKIQALRKKAADESKKTTESELTDLQKAYKAAFSAIQGFVNTVFNTIQDKTKDGTEKMQKILEELGQGGMNLLMNQFGRAADDAFAAAIKGGQGFGAALMASGSAGMAAIAPILPVVLAIVAAAVLLWDAFQRNAAGIRDAWDSMVSTITSSDLMPFLQGLWDLLVVSLAQAFKNLVWQVKVVVQAIDMILGPVLRTLGAFFSWAADKLGGFKKTSTASFKEVSDAHRTNLMEEKSALEELVKSANISTDDRAAAEKRLAEIRDELRQRDLERTRQYYKRLEEELDISLANRTKSELEAEKEKINLKFAQMAGGHDISLEWLDPNNKDLGMTWFWRNNGQIVEKGDDAFDHYLQALSDIETERQNAIKLLETQFGMELGDTVVDVEEQARRQRAQTEIDKARSAGDEARALELERAEEVRQTNVDIDAKIAEAKLKYGTSPELDKLLKAFEALRKDMLEGINFDFLQKSLESISNISVANPLPVKVVEMPPAFPLLDSFYFRSQAGGGSSNSLSIQEGAIVVQGSQSPTETAGAVLNGIKGFYDQMQRESYVRSRMVNLNGI